MSDSALKAVADHGWEVPAVPPVQNLPGGAPGDAHYVWVSGIAHNATDPEVDKALEKLRVEEARADSALAPEQRLGYDPRPVFMLCLGTINTNYRLRLKEGRRAHALQRLNGHTIAEIEAVSARSVIEAVEIARQMLGGDAKAFSVPSAELAADEAGGTEDTSEGAEMKEARAKSGDADRMALEDADWEVHDDGEEKQQLRSLLTQALTTFLRFAERQRAVLWIPWYLNEPQNAGAYFFDSVLQHAGFTGPIVCSCPALALAASPEEVGQPIPPPFEYLPGEGAPFSRWPCLRRTTHFVGGTVGSEANAHTAIMTTLEGRLVRRLAAGARVVGADPTHPAVAVAINGGKGVLWALAGAAVCDIPILLLEGTGRLCDALPSVWLRRSLRDFNAPRECAVVLAACGFKGGGPGHNHLYGQLLTQVLRGRLMVHSLRSRDTVLWRVLERELGPHLRPGGWTDRCFEEAKERCLEYHAAAAKYEWPARVLNAMYLFGGILITLLTVVKQQIEPQAAEPTSPCAAAASLNLTVSGASIDETSTEDASASQSGTALKYTLAILPVLLSVAVSLRKDLSQSAKASAFKYGAALAEEHLWLFCTMTGPYSNAALAARPNATASDSNDVPTSRAELLLAQIGEIERTVIHQDTTVATRRADMAASSSAHPPRARRHRHAAAPPEWLRRRVPPGPLTAPVGDEYVQLRLSVRLAEQQRAEQRGQRQLVVMKTLTYLIGAAGSVLTLVGFDPWVAVTTAIVTAIAAWDAATPLEDALRRSRAASRALSALRLWWDAKNDDKEWQETCDALVERAERAIVGVTPRPVSAAQEEMVVRDERAST